MKRERGQCRRTAHEDGSASLARGDERLVEMQNGMICCTLREDLLVEVSKLAREGRFDYLFVESTGISEPLPAGAAPELSVAQVDTAAGRGA